MVVPLYPASLLFVGLSGLLLALSANSGYLGVIPAIMLLSWLFKYGYVMLEHVAHGRLDAPVVSLEMLGPFEPRPWVQLFLVVCVYSSVQWLGGHAAVVLSVAALLLFPATVGVLGTANHLIDAFNPLALWRILRGLSYYYLLILAVVAVVTLCAVYLASPALWPALRYALMELLILSAFSFIGGAIYARRGALNFEPRTSPERALAKVEATRRHDRQRLFDELYQCVNARQYQAVALPLHRWLQATDLSHLQEDVPAIAAAALNWHNPRGTTAVLRALITWLVDAGKPTEAVQTLRTAVERDADFSLTSESHTLALARSARTVGQPRLALQVLNRFERRQPEVALSAAALQLRQELSVANVDALSPDPLSPRPPPPPHP